MPCRSKAWPLLLVFAAILPGSVRGATPPDPFRLLFDKPDFVLRIDNPRLFVETALGFRVVQPLKELESVREIMSSTNVVRGLRLLAYVENKLGCKWPELLDRLAGNGIVLGIRFEGDNSQAQLAFDGKEEAVVRKFFDLAEDIVNQELGRIDPNARLQRGLYRSVPTRALGDGLHIARVGSAILVANSETLLHNAVDRALGPAKACSWIDKLTQARRLLPGDPLAWFSLDLDSIRRFPGVKEVLAWPRNNPALTVLFGGLLDVARRSPFVCGALAANSHEIRMTVRMPRGRNGMPPELSVHVPQGPSASTLPILEPKGVIASTSFYLDIGQFWKERTRLFNTQQVKDFENADKTVAPFLLGNKLNKLLDQAGARFRAVAATPFPMERTGYGYGFSLDYAVVAEMRDPGFAKSVGAILRGGALLVGTQVKLAMTEEKIGDVTLVYYRVSPKSADVPLAPPLSFIPSFCFARVGNQFLVSSTVELGRELVRILRREAQEASKGYNPAVVETRVYGTGAAGILRLFEDVLVTQAILGRPATPEASREDVRRLISLVEKLGQLHIATMYGSDDFHVDISLATTKELR